MTRRDMGIAPGSAAAVILETCRQTGACTATQLRRALRLRAIFTDPATTITQLERRGLLVATEGTPTTYQAASASTPGMPQSGGADAH